MDLRKDEAIERTFKGVAKNFREVFAGEMRCWGMRITLGDASSDSSVFDARLQPYAFCKCRHDCLLSILMSLAKHV